jgi:hypothetical protein
MSVLHLSHAPQPTLTGERRLTLMRALRRLRAAFRIMHHAIVTARLRRLEGEWMFHGPHGEEPSADHDAAKFPQRPLVLDDKWDF